MAIVLECKSDKLARQLGATVAYFNQKTLIWTIPAGMLAVKTDQRMLVWTIIGDEVKDPLQKRRVP